MKRFKWSLFKTLKYMNSRRQNIDLRPSFTNQLDALEKRLFKDDKTMSNKWTEQIQDDVEETIMCNTYMNAQMSQYAD